LTSFSCATFDDLILNGILKIGQEPHSVLKLDCERLIVNRRPSSTDIVSLAILSILAHLRLNLVLVHDLDLPKVLFGEIKVVILLDYLQFVWHCVSAQLVRLEQIHFVTLLIHVEVPYAVHLPA
jgi:hypothetical protein